MLKEKEIPLTPEAFSNDEDREFLVLSKNEIQHILRAVYARNTRTALYYNEGHNFILTMLLGISDEGIWIDPPSRPQDHRNILNSNKLTFVSSHNQAKIQFDADNAEPGVYEERAAIFLSHPKKLIRLQRRDYFRLPAWPKNPLTCLLKPGMNLAREQHEATVMDISIGGVALVSEESELELKPGSTFKNCKIELPSVGTLTAAVEVKSTFEVTASTGKKMRRAGCEFVKPDSNTTGLLQRYVAHMQREATTKE